MACLNSCFGYTIPTIPIPKLITPEAQEKISWVSNGKITSISVFWIESPEKEKNV